LKLTQNLKQKQMQKLLLMLNWSQKLTLNQSQKLTLS
tara:strand:+ start:1412 stop:1522 length:111 start_codon:yes stop_codon:yes gene_type:complete